MPNKYEREIEEILRNLERTEPKSGFGKKFGGRLRRKPELRPVRDERPRTGARSRPSWNFTFSDWCLLIACCTALFAGGWAFAHGRADIVTGAIALVGAACVAIIAISPFVGGARRKSSRYGNVTPIRRNPLSSLGTRWNLFILKLRYKRRKDR